MNIDPSTAPKEVKEDLKNLQTFLSQTLPAKKLDQNVLICAWNIRMFGGLTMKWESQEEDSPKRDMHSLLCIVEILRRFPDLDVFVHPSLRVFVYFIPQTIYTAVRYE